MEDAMLWSRHGKKIKCELCARECLIEEGQSGFCKVRVNKNGTLYTKTFGKILTMNIDPIEKKPFFHFYPGSQALSLSSFGCNFRCQFCINSDISQNYKERDARNYTPEDIVKLANQKKVKIIAYTYGEPTVFFEFAYKTARIARRYNIKNVFVTNGYLTSEAVKKIGKYLDAVTVDIKGSLNPELYKKYCSVPDVEPILTCLKKFNKHRVFTEITNLIIPKIGDKEEDNRKLVEWITNNLSSSVPYHLLQFTPSYKLTDLPPTDPELLEKMAFRSKQLGMRYVYIGNIWGTDYENTYCYNCGYPVIERTGMFVNNINLGPSNRCPNCGAKINIKRE